MQDLLNLKADCLNLWAAVEDTFSSPSVEKGLDTLGKAIAVLSDVKGIAGLFVGPAVMTASAEADRLKCDIHDCCEKIAAKCAAEGHKVGGGPVGALGDGTFLKAFVSLLPTILAFIQALLPKQPQPAAA